MFDKDANSKTKLYNNSYVDGLADFIQFKPKGCLVTITITFPQKQLEPIQEI